MLSTATSVALILHCVRSRSMWVRLGRYIPAAGVITEPLHVLAFKLAREVAGDHQYPTEDLMIQRATANRERGSVSDDDICALADLLSLEPPLDQATTLIEVVPLVQRILRADIARRTVAASMSDSPFADIVFDMEKVDRLGEAVADLDAAASEIGDDTESILSDTARGMQLRCGILELDTALGGGFLAMTFTTFMGDTGAGKSMALSHMAAAAALQGLNVGYVTTELSKGEVHARITAALTGIPTAAIKINPTERKRANDIVMRMKSQGTLGRIRVEKVDAGSASTRDVLTWVRTQEKLMKTRINVVIVDYADELTDGRHGKSSKYEHGETVWNGLATIAHDELEPRWVFTATQSQRPEFKHGEAVPLLRLNSVADSYAKPRKVDYWICLTPTPTMSCEEGYRIVIDKHRFDENGVLGRTYGPVPQQRHLGRLADMSAL